MKNICETCPVPNNCITGGCKLVMQSWYNEITIMQMSAVVLKHWWIAAYHLSATEDQRSNASRNKGCAV